MTFILTGPRRSGKTTLLADAAQIWKERGLCFGGVLSRGVGGPVNVTGYDIQDLKSGRSFPFLRRAGRPEWEKAGRFAVLPGAVEAAAKILLETPGDEPVIVDEAGPLELQGRGLWPALARLLSIPSKPRLVVVRDSLLARFRVFAALEQASVVSVDDPDAAEKFSMGLFR